MRVLPVSSATCKICSREFVHSRVDQIDRNFSAGTAGSDNFARKHGGTVRNCQLLQGCVSPLQLLLESEAPPVCVAAAQFHSSLVAWVVHSVRTAVLPLGGVRGLRVSSSRGHLDIGKL